MLKTEKAETPPALIQNSQPPSLLRPRSTSNIILSSIIISNTTTIATNIDITTNIIMIMITRKLVPLVSGSGKLDDQP